MAVVCLTRVRRVVALVVASTVLIAVVTPQPVYAQIEAGPILAAVASVLNTINNVIRGLFSAANNVLNQINAGMQASEPDEHRRVPASADRQRPWHGVFDDRDISRSAVEHLQYRRRQRTTAGAVRVRRCHTEPERGRLRRAVADLWADLRQLPPAANASPMERDLIDADDAAARRCSRR